MDLLRFRMLYPGASAPASALLLPPYGDSRGDPTFGDVVIGADIHSGVGFGRWGGEPGGAPHLAYLNYLMSDVDLSANGGVSSDESSNWDSPLRLRPFEDFVALGGHGVPIQYGNNDVVNNVSDATTRDAVAADVTGHLEDLAAELNERGLKVGLETIMQRTEAGWGSNAALKRECVDIINANLLAFTAGADPDWVKGIDLRALTNEGGATTGAYARADYFDSLGVHLNYTGIFAILPTVVAAWRDWFPDRGLVPMYRGTGPNLISSLDATTFPSGSFILFNCTVDSVTFDTVDGMPRVTLLVTPHATDAGFLGYQILADVGTSGGHTPAQTFNAGDKLKGQFFQTLDDGAGGPSGCTNLWSNLYCSFLTAGTEQLQVSGLGAGPSALPALANARIITPTKAMPAGSEDIGAPAGGAGLRLFNFIHTAGGGAQFRAQITDPQIRVVT